MSQAEKQQRIADALARRAQRTMAEAMQTPPDRPPVEVVAAKVAAAEPTAPPPPATIDGVPTAQIDAEAARAAPAQRPPAVPVATLASRPAASVAKFTMPRQPGLGYPASYAPPGKWLNPGSKRGQLLTTMLTDGAEPTDTMARFGWVARDLKDALTLLAKVNGVGSYLGTDGRIYASGHGPQAQAIPLAAVTR